MRAAATTAAIKSSSSRRTAESCCGSARAAHAGDGPTHFNGPTDVVVAANGNVFVSDGHETMSNNRIVKLAADGTFIKEWGGTGSEPGQFLVPHALALDSQGRLFVADRDNNRIQIFDQDGNFLERVDAVRPAERNPHRGRRHAVRLGQSIERRAPPGLAARHLCRQREGRLRQRVHSGPRVRSGASAGDRRARARGRRRRHDLRRRGLLAERQEVRALIGGVRRLGGTSVCDAVVEQLALGQRAVALELLDLVRQLAVAAPESRRCA